MTTEYYELIGSYRGKRVKVASGSWDDIEQKMQGASTYIKKKMNNDVSRELVVLFGIVAWWALFSLVAGV